MKTSHEAKPIITVSNILSMVFSPLFVPIYGTAIAFAVTPLRYLTLATLVQVISIVATFTAILPLFILFIMKKTGRISDIDISNRRQRTLPIILMLVCYILAMLYIAGVHGPAWLILYFASGIATALVLGIITVACKWKISMHGAGMGNLIGLVVALEAFGISDFNLLWLISVIIIVAGMVGTARIILNKHTIMQVFCGTVLSAFITFFLISLSV